jgi:hypothetical protein
LETKRKRLGFPFFQETKERKVRAREQKKTRPFLLPFFFFFFFV